MCGQRRILNFQLLQTPQLLQQLLRLQRLLVGRGQALPSALGRLVRLRRLLPELDATGGAAQALMVALRVLVAMVAQAALEATDGISRGSHGSRVASAIGRHRFLKKVPAKERSAWWSC